MATVDFKGPAVREEETDKDVLRGYTNAFEGANPRLHKWYAARQNGQLRFFSEVEKNGGNGPPPPCNPQEENFLRNCEGPFPLPLQVTIQPPNGIGDIVKEPSGEDRWVPRPDLGQCEWRRVRFPPRPPVICTLTPNFEEPHVLPCFYEGNNASVSFDVSVSLWILQVTYFATNQDEITVEFFGTMNPGLSRNCSVPLPQGLYSGRSDVFYTSQVHWRAMTVA